MKFTKINSSVCVLVLVPADYYRQLKQKIKDSVHGVHKTRMYVYYIDGAGFIYRYPRKIEGTAELLEAKHLERVINEWEFNPETMMP